MTRHKNKHIKCLGIYELYGKSSFHRRIFIIRFIVTNIHNAEKTKCY